jgi:hypothetical protein
MDAYGRIDSSWPMNRTPASVSRVTEPAKIRWFEERRHDPSVPLAFCLARVFFNTIGN